MIFPQEATVPFPAWRLQSACQAYANPRFGNFDWDNYAFAVPSELDDASLFSSEVRTFRAERYGGEGLSTNGGGARCGIWGDFQAKGIGKTPLAGVGADFWHSHGGLTLKHAVVEVVWGEVLARALPFGSVRCASIIDPHALTWAWAKADGGRKEQQPRAILVRENAVRPANFERAHSFRPPPELTLPHDTERTKAMIGRIHAFLPGVPVGIDAPASLSLISEGLTEMVKRFAVQAAAAKARRIMHGAISSSNICLDGRWIDYGTVAAMPSYANSCSFGMAPYTLPFWDDRLAYVRMVSSLCFYLCKFSPVMTIPHQELCGHLIRIFDSCHEETLVKQFFRLCGFPAAALRSKEDTPDGRILGKFLMQVARGESRGAFVPSGPGQEVFGKNELADLLPALARAAQKDPVLSSVPEHVEQIAGQRLLSAYRAVYLATYNETKLSYPEINNKSYGRLVELNALNRTRDMTLLTKYGLLDEVKQSIEQYREGDELAIQKLVDRALLQAELAYCDPSDLIALVQSDKGTLSAYDPLSDRYEDVRPSAAEANDSEIHMK